MDHAAYLDPKAKELDLLIGGEKTRCEQATSFHWHENSHLGQLEILKAFIDSKK